MKDDGRNDGGRDLIDIERALGRLAPAPAPPGLRERVMDRALEVRKSAVLTPGLRVLAAACAVIIVVVLGLDPLIGKREATRLAALFDGRPAAAPVGEAASDLAEMLVGKGAEADRMARLQAMTRSAVRRDLKHDLFEARKRLKGWLENETSEDLN